MVFSDLLVENATLRGRKPSDLTQQLLSYDTLERLEDYFAEDNARFARAYFGRETLFMPRTLTEAHCDPQADPSGALRRASGCARAQGQDAGAGYWESWRSCCGHAARCAAQRIPARRGTGAGRRRELAFQIVVGPAGVPIRLHFGPAVSFESGNLRFRPEPTLSRASRFTRLVRLRCSS